LIADSSESVLILSIKVLGVSCVRGLSSGRGGRLGEQRCSWGFKCWGESDLDEAIVVDDTHVTQLEETEELSWDLEVLLDEPIVEDWQDLLEEVVECCDCGSEVEFADVGLRFGYLANFNGNHCDFRRHSSEYELDVSGKILD